jgi:hypothetical protein
LASSEAPNPEELAASSILFTNCDDVIFSRELTHGE